MVTYLGLHPVFQSPLRREDVGFVGFWFVKTSVWSLVLPLYVPVSYSGPVSEST